MVYNTFPWPQFKNAGYPEISAGKPLCVRETHAAFLMGSMADYDQEVRPRKKAAKPAGDKSAANPQKARVEVAAQAVLDARAKHTLSTLADLYDPLTMPADLVKAHADLDRAVDQCYQKQPFTSDRQRIEFLFALYERYTSPLLPATKPKRKRAASRNVK